MKKTNFLFLLFFITTLTAFGAATLGYASASAESSCASLKTFQPATQAHDIKIEIDRFTGDPRWAPVMTILLREYLAHANHVVVLPISLKPGALLVGANFNISGSVEPDGSRFHAKVSLVNASQLASGFITGIVFFDGFFDSPESLNQLLLTFVEKLSKSLGQPLKARKLLPFLNHTSSPTAFEDYALGMLSLNQAEGVTHQDIEQAIRAFEQAIQADYNYLYAYLSLAEAYAALSAFERITPSTPTRTLYQMTVNLEKAKLLNPDVTKTRIPRIEWYSKGSAENLCLSSMERGGRRRK